MSLSTSTLKTVVLNPGECVVLPKDAIVESIIIDGSASLTSTCGNLPTPSSYKCGYFYFICDVDANDGHSMDENYTYITSIKVGGITYIINERLLTSGSDPGFLVTESTLNLHITDLSLFRIMSINRLILAKRQGINLFFKVPEALFDTVELKLDNRGSTQYYKPIPIACETYPIPS